MAYEFDPSTGIYGYELVLDLRDCDPATFTRENIDQYFTELCEKIDMERIVVHFWDDVGLPPEECQTSPHTKGTSAVCFILTSSIVVHTLDDLGVAFVNIFSCKSFSAGDALVVTQQFFRGTSHGPTFLERRLTPVEE